MKTILKHRMICLKQPLSNPEVAGSSPAGPTTQQLQYDTDENLANSNFASLSQEFPVTELLCSAPDGSIKRVKIDTADLPKALAVSTRWRVANFYPRGFRLYAYCSVRGDRKRCGTYHHTVYLHRVLTGHVSGMDVDHSNHDSLDNRRSCNLRVVTHKQNQNNRIDKRRAQ